MEQNQNSTFSRGMRGLFTGMRSGLIMMGIYALVMATVAFTGIAPALIAANPSFLGALTSMLPTAAIGVAVTSLFSAVTNVLNPPQTTVQLQGRDGVMRTARITQAPGVAMPIVMGHSVAAERSHEVQAEQHPAHGQAAWADRVGHGRKDRIAEIIANGSMSDKDRAAALQAERATASTETGRA